MRGIKSRPSFRPLLADHVPGLPPPKHYGRSGFLESAEISRLRFVRCPSRENVNARNESERHSAQIEPRGVSRKINNDFLIALAHKVYNLNKAVYQVPFLGKL